MVKTQGGLKMSKMCQYLYLQLLFGSSLHLTSLNLFFFFFFFVLNLEKKKKEKEKKI